MRYATYDVEQHTWESSVGSLGANGVVATADGVVVGYGDGDYMRYATYDVEQHAWESSAGSLGANGVIATADGVVVGYGDGDYMRYATYDVEQHAWESSAGSLGANGVIATADGVVVGYGDGDYMRYATYDVEQHAWESSAGSLGANGVIATADGVVVGYGAGNYMRYAMYDIDQNTWISSARSLGSNGAFTLSSGTISYTGSSSGIAGYNVSSHSWGSNPTGIACKFLPVSFTNSKWVYMQCMTMGAGGYTYSCGDGHQISRRAGWKKYNMNGTYNADLNVTNGVNNSTCNQTINIATTAVAGGVNAIHLQLSPNPVSDRLSLSSSEPINGTFEVSIFDITGKKVHQSTETNANCTISVKDCAAGMYFLQVFSAEKGLVYSQKWVKI